jgi:hypothetical protein
MITITHATLGCSEWTEGQGITKDLWEIANDSSGIDMGIGHVKLEGLLRAVASNLDYMENMGGRPAADLWPDIRSLSGWHNDVTDAEPHRWCSAWSLPIDGKVYCVDLWLAGPGCEGAEKNKQISPAPWRIDFDNGGTNFDLAEDKHIVLSDNKNGVVALVPKDVPANAFLIQAAPKMRQEMQEALRWLREHAGYMGRDVREGYDATCDGLEATINTSFPPTKEA